jgi:transcriptional regulator with XRE-family HTH domain
MKTREQLLKTEEYWFETLQNEIYRMVSEYLEKENINQTELAEKLGVSKSYISQIMNGNFNYTLKKLIELSLAVNKAPVIDFNNINEFIIEDKQKRFKMQYQPFFNIKLQPHKTPVHSGITENSSIVENQNPINELNAA